MSANNQYTPVSAIPTGFTPLTSFNTVNTLETLRREQQCKEKKCKRRDVEGRSIRFYYCSEKDCSYALLALLPQALTEMEGPIHLFVKDSHNHQVVKAIGPQGVVLPKTPYDELDSREDVEQRRMDLRLAKYHCKGAVRLRYRCTGCPLKLHANPTDYGSYLLYTSTPNAEHKVDCTLPPAGGGGGRGGGRRHQQQKGLVPDGYTFLLTLHSMDELDSFRRNQQTNADKGVRRATDDGSYRLLYYCTERGCSYALCALFLAGASADGSEEGEGLIQLYSKNNHSHPVKPIRHRGYRAEPDIQEEVESVDELEIVEGGWA